MQGAPRPDAGTVPPHLTSVSPDIDILHPPVAPPDACPCSGPADSHQIAATSSDMAADPLLQPYDEIVAVCREAVMLTLTNTEAVCQR